VSGPAPTNTVERPSKGGDPPHRNVRTRVLVPAAAWPGMVAGSVAVALLVAPWYVDDSPWLSVGVALAVFVAWHSFRASSSVPWFPGLIAFGACVQWVLAPWMIYHYHDFPRVSPMAVEARDYFSFAVPAAVALVAGMYWPLSGAGTARWARAARFALSEPGRTVPGGFRSSCELMVFGGIAARVLLAPFAPGSLRFLVQLLSLLSWVGAFGLLLVGAPGWKQRVVLVLGLVALSNAADQQFLDLLTWCSCFGLLLVYRYKPRPRVVLPTGAALLVLFLAINAFKAGSRDGIRSMTMDRSERAALTGATLYAMVRDPALIFSPQNFVVNANRLNQGFIIARILAWVPSAEPFAGGETIVSAVRSAVVPRVLDPGKYVVGGGAVIPRFTGLQLIGGTSMGLSVPGEMYANFGRTGAVFGTLLYGLLLGLVFRAFLRRAQSSVVWWAWAPFVLVAAFTAEQGVAEVLNTITKSWVVMFAVVAISPAWAELRRGSRRTRVARRVATA
jgi:hypothetical protein